MHSTPMDKKACLEIIRSFHALTSDIIQKLESYSQQLLAWNQKINLIGKSTQDELWSRHIVDSAQLVRFLPGECPGKPKTIIDFGSGAGLPVVVMALLAPHHHYHAIESVGKKAIFLREMVRILELPLTVHNERIESIKNCKADIITARAFASTGNILAYAEAFLQKESLCILLKGCKAKEELDAAGRDWTFTLNQHPSLSEADGSVIILSNIERNIYG